MSESRFILWGQGDDQAAATLSVGALAAGPQAMGGKAWGLASLQALAQQRGEAELPIPPWFVVTPAAFFDSLPPPHKLRWADPALPDAVRQEILATLVPSEAVTAAIQAALATLTADPAPRLAVRSSAVAEDGPDHSFAGQLDSFLNVRPAAVPAQVAAVWRSGYGARLAAYRAEHQLPLGTPPAVLVQMMVPAVAAGVAFSAQPVTGQRAIALVTAVAGLGEKLVAGEVAGETYQVDRQAQITPAPQQDRAGKSVLNPEQVVAIAHLTRRLAALTGQPQDIEWAWGQDRLWLLQARPITTLTHMADPDGIRQVWDNSNIAESYGGITTPLTFSFAQRVYEEVYRQFCQIMGVPTPTIQAQAATFRHLLGLMRGRIYYNLLNWYRVLALLPGFQVNQQFMEQMMGVKEPLPPDVLASLAATTRSERFQDSLRLGRTVIGLLWNYLFLPRRIRRFEQRLNQALAAPTSDLATWRPDELVDYYQDLERQLLTHWDAPLINDFFAMIFYGVLRKLTVAWCGDEAGTLQNDLVSGEGGMISAEPAQRVQQMSVLAAVDPELVELLCHGSLAQILPRLTKYPALWQAYQDYLTQFGDRCLEELKLESTTLHEDPLLLLRSVGRLAQWTDQQNFPTSQPVSTQPSVRTEAEAQVAAALAGQWWRQRVFGWVLHNARQRVRDRENLRFERTRLFGRVRQIFLAIGQQWQSLGLLAVDRDIFYLELPEILGMVAGTATCTQLADLVAVRQREFEQFRTLPAPADRFETRGMVHQGHDFQALTQADEELDLPEDQGRQGTGCCPGRVRGQVQVVQDPSQAQLQPGKILVAVRTDPGWIMLFPGAIGLLVERGSLLSHSAIVARELGLPAIVAVPGVTTWLQTGDWVEFDGRAGWVRKLTAEELAGNGPADNVPKTAQIAPRSPAEPVISQPFISTQAPNPSTLSPQAEVRPSHGE